MILLKWRLTNSFFTAWIEQNSNWEVVTEWKDMALTFREATTTHTCAKFRKIAKTHRTLFLKVMLKFQSCELWCLWFYSIYVLKYFYEIIIFNLNNLNLSPKITSNIWISQILRSNFSSYAMIFQYNKTLDITWPVSFSSCRTSVNNGYFFTL